MVRLWTPLLLILITVLAACQAEQPAAVISQVSSTRTCATCEIVVDTVVTLSGPAEAFVEWPQSAWTDSRERFFLAQPNKRIPPTVFGSDGRFLRFLGREGDGPGEFRYAAHIAGDAHDSVLIADWGTARLSVFGPDLTFVRSFGFPSSVGSFAILSNGTLVSNSRMAAEGGTAIQSFDRHGARQSGFNLPYRGNFDYQFLITQAADGGLWAVRLWGRHLMVHFPLIGAPSWFEAKPAWYLGFPDEPAMQNPPPHSSVRGIWESQDGTLWLATQVEDSIGNPVMDTVRPEGIPVAVPRDSDAAFDTMLEVFDPATSQLIAVKRFADVYAVAAGKGRMIHVRETTTSLQFTIVRFRLVRP